MSYSYRRPAYRSPGPQYPSDQQAILDRTDDLPDSFTAWIGQCSGSSRRGPPIIGISTGSSIDSNELRSRLRGWVNSISLPGLAPDVVFDDPIPINRQALPPDISLDAGIILWQHPLTQSVQRALDSLDDLSTHELTWNPNHAQLKLDPLLIHWDEISPLALSLSAAEDHGALDDIIHTLRSEVVLPEPTAYIVGFETSENPSTAEARAARSCTLILGFEDQAALANAKSRVYLDDGRELPAKVDQGGMRQVQLTITSPPYLDVIDYDAFTDSSASDWGGTTTTDLEAELKAWKELQIEVFSSVYRATQEGGYCAVIIGDVKRTQGTRVDLPGHMSAVMNEIGWQLHEKIIWDKTTSRDGNFGTTIQHPYPTYYYPNQQHESILVFRKGPVRNRKDEQSRFALTELMKQEIANNVWHIAPVPANKDIEHPCPYPEELVYRLTLLYSCEGDIVADPMAGSGTTVKVADRLNRVAIGTELRPAYVSVARERLAAETYTRRDQLLPEYERVRTTADETRQQTLSESHSNSENPPSPEQPTLIDFES